MSEKIEVSLTDLVAAVDRGAALDVTNQNLKYASSDLNNYLDVPRTVDQLVEITGRAKQGVIVALGVLRKQGQVKRFLFRDEVFYVSSRALALFKSDERDDSELILRKPVVVHAVKSAPKTIARYNAKVKTPEFRARARRPVELKIQIVKEYHACKSNAAKQAVLRKFGVPTASALAYMDWELRKYGVLPARATRGMPDFVREAARESKKAVKGGV
jgi:hypothetical protein